MDSRGGTRAVERGPGQRRQNWTTEVCIAERSLSTVINDIRSLALNLRHLSSKPSNICPQNLQRSNVEPLIFICETFNAWIIEICCSVCIKINFVECWPESATFGMNVQMLSKFVDDCRQLLANTNIWPQIFDIRLQMFNNWILDFQHLPFEC